MALRQIPLRVYAIRSGVGAILPRSNLPQYLSVVARNLEAPMVDDLRSIPGVSSDEVEALLTKAVRCRRLAAQSLDQKTSERLKELALECETRAAEISSGNKY